MSRHVSGGGCETRLAGLSQQAGEAGGSLTLEVNRRPGEPKTGQPLRLGMRWAVERTNSWLSNFGQLRRNTDRNTAHRLAQIALAITLLLTAKLIDWAHRWNRP